MCGGECHHASADFDQTSTFRNIIQSSKVLLVSCTHVFADPVVIAGVPHPIPSRTRPLSPLALMVLRLKARESKSLPGQLKHACIMQTNLPFDCMTQFGLLPRKRCLPGLSAGFFVSGGRSSDHHSDAGWSSPVARQAHNLKVVGSNPTPAPK